jgi:hypothetical protein
MSSTSPLIEVLRDSSNLSEDVLEDSGFLNETYLSEAASNFEVFLRDFIGLQPAPFHLEWNNIFETNPRSVIMAPRGFAKTTTLGVFRALWKTRFSEINGGPWDFCLMSHSLPQAANIMNPLRRLLESNPLFSDLLPPPTSSLKNHDHLIQLTEGSNIHVRPYSRSAVGIHVNYYIFDEGSKVLDPQLFFDDLSAIVNHKDGNICVIGTPDRPGDLLDRLFRNNEYYSKLYDAEGDYPSGPVLWPEVFPYEKLMVIKEREGLSSYLRNYRCILQGSGDQVWPPELVASRCDDSIQFLREPYNKEVRDVSPAGFVRSTYVKNEDWTYFTGVDLALSPQGDYMVTTTVGVNQRLGTIDIVDIRKTRGTSYETQLDVVQQVYNTYGPQQVLVDESVYGVPFIQDLIQKKFVYAKPYSFQGGRRQQLLNNLIRLMSNIRIPRNPDNPETLRLTDELIQELTGFVFGQTKTGLRTYESTTTHDDMVMSLALAVFPTTTILSAAPAEGGSVQVSGYQRSSDVDPFDVEDDTFSFDTTEFEVSE